ncbi:uncharacterized protein NECHADRAFT_92458 [Fusarium vanettenii 77-13-4]|uniref:Uncharacterized protein n=1 Tax=Fusarium vanettenii (strain ATCC MYA-4622 / CBS 123669 / FGSC 9596 / NRRL 45880 / 77-13-4) TaxID=660122 RepID=C7YP93_FUSV7|nr:uncharacterized protein NECHADRAFT_92458 [Fusarium vanettenii 77-13-4]EEU46259.1 hypothetical protein NECHADRAFT_92458 [Fusarium vanettenii 77-13-4]
MDSFVNHPSSLSLSPSAMDVDASRRTPSPVPSLGHDSLSTPTTEMTTPPIFSSAFAVVKGSEPAGRLSIMEQPDMRNPVNGWASPSFPKDQKPRLPVIGGTPDFLILYCFNIRRAADFYSRCFGWKFYGDMNAREIDDPSKRQWGSSFFDVQPMNFFNSSEDKGQLKITGALVQMRTTPDSQARLEHKRQMARFGAATPTCHLRVPDLGDAEELIEQNFGEVKHLRYGIRQFIMDVGEFIDTEGNLVGLISLHPENANAA